MKATFYISVFAVLLVSSCTASRFNQGGEYDDLYYSGSDKQSENQNIVRQETKTNPATDIYYDNIYSGDTLIADGYNDAVDFDGSMFYNSESSPFEYADDYSYSNRLRRFYGNYFDPYWRDPYYYYGYSGGYYPYYDPFMYSPYYGYGGMYMSFGFGFGYGYGYGGYYPGYGYGGYYPYYGYGGYYPGYGYGGYYPPYYSENYTPAAMGRRQTYSTLTSNYSNIAPSRKSGYQSTGGVTSDQRRATTGSAQVGASDDRRGYSLQDNSRQGSTRQGTTAEARNRETYQNSSKEGVVKSNTINSRPEYNSQNRTYTPSYNNPRMSERPSYNNSRVSGNRSQQGNTVSSRPGNNPGNNYGRSVNEASGFGRMGTGNGNSGRTISNSSNERNSSVRYPSSNNYTVPSGNRGENSSSSSRSSNYNSGSGYSGSSGGYSGGSSSGGSVGSGGGGGGYGGRSSGGGSGTRR